MKKHIARKAAFSVSKGLHAMGATMGAYADLCGYLRDLCEEAGDDPGFLRWVGRASADLFGLAGQFKSVEKVADRAAKAAVDDAFGADNADASDDASDADQAQA